MQKDRYPLQVASPLEIPAVIARSYLCDKYPALRLSKCGVALNYVLDIKSEPRPFPTIHILGPDLLGEKEAVTLTPYFSGILGQDWADLDSSALSEGYVNINSNSVRQLESQYEYNGNVHSIAAALWDLPTVENVQIAYDLAFGRTVPNGSVRTLGSEAFSDIISNTLRRNLTRAHQQGLLKEKASVENPVGEIEIKQIDNSLDESSFPFKDCLKIGTTNNLVTYRAVWILNCTGFQANRWAVAYLTASHFLLLTVRLKRMKYKARHAGQANRVTRNYFDERICKLEEERRSLGRIVIRNVDRSLSSLVKDNAVEFRSGEYVTKGNTTKSPYGEVKLDSRLERDENARAFTIISQTHRLTLALRNVAPML